METSYDKFVRNHQADLPQTGFDYQLYCYLCFMFKSSSEDRVIYEGEDDIDRIRKDGHTLIQIKHSVDSGAHIRAVLLQVVL